MGSGVLFGSRENESSFVKMLGATAVSFRNRTRISTSLEEIY